MWVYRPMTPSPQCAAREKSLRTARHRLDEAARLSVSMVASLQSLPPFHLVTVIVTLDSLTTCFPFREAQTLSGPPKPVLHTDPPVLVDVSRKVKLYRSCGILSVDAK